MRRMTAAVDMIRYKPPLLIPIRGVFALALTLALSRSSRSRSRSPALVHAHRGSAA